MVVLCWADGVTGYLLVAAGLGLAGGCFVASLRFVVARVPAGYWGLALGLLAAAVAGVALGNLGNALAASLGFAALFAVSAAAFMVVKYAGALYLVYLGVRMLGRAQDETPAALDRDAPLGRIFRDGFIVALLNQ
ncbi:MAG: hypothetical protein B7X58_05825, partial [Marinobacter sp. 34-60-7]